MTVIVLFLLGIGAVIFWWLSQQRLMSKPWLEEGAAGDLPGTGALTVPAAKIGLGVFLAVAGCLFALLISAYFMRTAPAETTLADWVSLPAPKLMWVNTAVLAVSSVALQGAVAAAKQSHRDALKSWLLAGGVTALAFLAGQLLAWRQLADAGWFLATNPSSSFFYLITGAHGLHVAGGLVALGRTMGKAWGGCKADRLRLSVELCAWYWHFLLLVWLIVFTLLTGWAGDFASVCRQLLS